ADGDALGSGEDGLFGVAAVTRVAGLAAGAGDVVQRFRFQVDAIDGVAFAEGEIQAVLAVEVEGPRTVERCALQRRAIGGGTSFAGPGEGRDDTGGGIDATDAMIADVADVEVAFTVEGDRVRAVEGGF